MKRLLKISLVLIMACCAGRALASGFERPVEIPSGIYENDNDEGVRCAIQVEPRFWKKHSVTVFRDSPQPDIVPSQTLKSDPFSFREMIGQASESGGAFSITTRKTSTKHRRVSGRLFEEKGALFWQVVVFSEGCVGFCSSHTVRCLVRIK